MNRRLLLASLAALPFARPAFAAGEWQARLIPGAFDGKLYTCGLHIVLAPGWKTYWRVPGEAGIPPDIKLEGANIASIEVAYPLPTRSQDGSGEAIGYHGEVLFPIAIKPQDAGKPVSAKLSALFGICQQICKPAKFEGALDLSPNNQPGADDALIHQWQMRLPSPASFVKAASISEKTLTLTLDRAVDDIFIEGPDGLYFRKPEFSGNTATLKIDGDTPLSGLNLRITAAMQGKGLEQQVTVP